MVGNRSRLFSANRHTEEEVEPTIANARALRPRCRRIVPGHQTLGSGNSHKLRGTQRRPIRVVKHSWAHTTPHIRAADGEDVVCICSPGKTVRPRGPLVSFLGLVKTLPTIASA